MIRLDLERLSCVRVQVVAHADLTDEAVHAIATGSYGVPEPVSERSVTMYGSSYRLGDAKYVVTGRVSRVHEDDHHIEISYLPSSAGSPPRVIRSIDALLERLNEWLGTRELECTVLFEYRSRLGFSSKIPLPIPYMLGNESPFTHIEGVSLGKREDGRLIHRVQASLSTNGRTLRHAVLVNLVDRFDRAP